MALPTRRTLSDGHSVNLFILDHTGHENWPGNMKYRVECMHPEFIDKHGSHISTCDSFEELTENINQTNPRFAEMILNSGLVK